MSVHLGLVDELDGGGNDRNDEPANQNVEDTRHVGQGQGTLGTVRLGCVLRTFTPVEPELLPLGQVAVLTKLQHSQVQYVPRWVKLIF